MNEQQPDQLALEDRLTPEQRQRAQEFARRIVWTHLSAERSKGRCLMDETTKQTEDPRLTTGERLAMF